MILHAHMPMLCGPHIYHYSHHYCMCKFVRVGDVE